MGNSNDDIKNAVSSNSVQLHPLAAQALGGLYFENYILKNQVATIKAQVDVLRKEAEALGKTKE